MTKLILIALSSLKIVKSLNCNLTLEKACGSGICLSNGQCLSFDQSSLLRVSSNSDNFIEKLFERNTAAIACSDDGYRRCKCKASKHGADCTSSCTGDQTESNADFSGCQCPGVSAGASFSDSTCSTCSPTHWPDNSCNNSCDASKGEFRKDAETQCTTCSETEIWNPTDKICVACGAGLERSSDGLVCHCSGTRAGTSHFKVPTACAEGDACDPPYNKVGGCIEKCSSDKYSDDGTCTACSNAAEGRIPNADQSDCQCTATSHFESTTDCSCKNNYYDSTSTAYKQACDVECENKVYDVTSGVATCSDCPDGQAWAPLKMGDGPGCVECPQNADCSSGIIVCNSPNFGYDTGMDTCEDKCPNDMNGQATTYNTTSQECGCPVNFYYTLADPSSDDTCDDCPPNSKSIGGKLTVCSAKTGFGGDYDASNGFIECGTDYVGTSCEIQCIWDESVNYQTITGSSAIQETSCLCKSTHFGDDCSNSCTANGTVQGTDHADGKCTCGITGYYGTALATSCQELPPNSSATETTKIGFVCNSGFFYDGTACVPCAAVNGDYVCLCNTGYEGADCSTVSSSSQDSNGFIFSMLTLFVGFFLTF